MTLFTWDLPVLYYSRPTLMRFLTLRSVVSEDCTEPRLVLIGVECVCASVTVNLYQLRADQRRQMTFITTIPTIIQCID